MGEVDVVLADEEQVELTVQAVQAVVVGDDLVEAVAFVPGDGLVDVFLDGVRHVFHQDRVAGGEQQAVMKDGQDTPRLFLLGDRVDAPGHDPETLLGGGVQQLREAGKPRARANVLALQGGYVAVYQQLVLAQVHEDQRAPVFRARRRLVELDGGVQPVLSVVLYRLRYVGPGHGVVVRRGGRRLGGRGGSGFRRRRRYRGGRGVRGRSRDGSRGRGRVVAAGNREGRERSHDQE